MEASRYQRASPVRTPSSAAARSAPRVAASSGGRGPMMRGASAATGTGGTAPNGPAVALQRRVERLGEPEACLDGGGIGSYGWPVARAEVPGVDHHPSLRAIVAARRGRQVDRTGRGWVPPRTTSGSAHAPPPALLSRSRAMRSRQPASRRAPLPPGRPRPRLLAGGGGELARRGLLPMCVDQVRRRCYAEPRSGTKLIIWVAVIISAIVRAAGRK